MKPVWKLLLLSAVLAVTPVATFAATNNNIMLVFNGNTEVNRHTYNFIRQEFSLAGLNYNIYATLDPAQVKPNTYKSVIVISTSTTSGVDPVLAKFMKSYAAPKELYLVDILSRSPSFAVTTFKAGSNAAGVDGVTAASTWGRGFGTSDPIAMHRTWVQRLAEYLGTL